MDFELQGNIGSKLARIRISKAKATQAVFAETIGITRGYYSELENGTKAMSVPMLIKICKALKTTPNKLLGF